MDESERKQAFIAAIALDVKADLRDYTGDRLDDALIRQRASSSAMDRPKTGWDDARGDFGERNQHEASEMETWMGRLRPSSWRMRSA